MVRGREILSRPISTAIDIPLELEGASGPARLTFPAATMLVLDPNDRRGQMTLAEYAQALEDGTLIDVLVEVPPVGATRGIAFSVSVQYDNPRDTGSLKPDASFALKLAHAAKGEREAAAWLRGLGHVVVGDAIHEPPYVVVIGRARGGHRSINQDLACTRCGRRFEIKTRDSYLRISSSVNRPFVTENASDDLQLFVLRHEKMRCFRNADVARYVSGRSSARSTYDTYVELPEEWAVTHEVAPASLVCSAAP
jgi:hypothetical protein